MDVKDIETQAKKEIEEEDFRKKVEEAKHRLRQHKSFFQTIFPFRIKIERR